MVSDELNADRDEASSTSTIVRSIIIPAFNEADRLPALLGALPTAVDPDTTEVIVVDDGSTDRTVQIAQQMTTWAARSKVIELPENRGKGHAVRTGVGAARGDVIIFIDADNATELSVLADLEAGLESAHAVFGSRNARGAVVIGSPPLRGWMGRTYSRVAQRVLGTSVSDSQCGCKAFRGPVAKVVFALSTLDGFAFDAEVLHFLERIGLTITEQPVHWTHITGSKIGLVDPFLMFADTVRVRLPAVPPPLPYISLPASHELAIERDIRTADPVGVIEDRLYVLLPFLTSDQIGAVAERTKIHGGEAIEISSLAAESRFSRRDLFEQLKTILA